MLGIMNSSGIIYQFTGINLMAQWMMATGGLPIAQPNGSV
jgi:hypothetical protein